MDCCKFCGEPLEENALFCGNCGAKIERTAETQSPISDDTDNNIKPADMYAPPAVQAPVQAPSANTPATAGNGGKSINLTKIIIGLVAVVVVCIVIAVSVNIFKEDSIPMAAGTSESTTETPSTTRAAETATQQVVQTESYVAPTQSTTAAAYTVMRVQADGGLRMRDAPSLETGNKILTIPNGTDVTVYKVSEGWAYVAYNGTQGWCSMDYLVAVTQP